MTVKCTKNRIIVPLLLILVLTVILVTLGGVYAKYIKAGSTDPIQVTSKNMYFTSDYLTEDGAEYTITGDKVTFQLRNYPDALRTSELNVEYTVTVSGGATVKIKPEGQSEFSDGESGELSSTKSCYVDVEISGLKSGQTYTVTAVGKNGFEQTLSATFTVKAAENQVFYRVEQTDYYVLLTVWTQNVKGDATISLPTGLIPDNTDSILSGVKTGQGSFTDLSSFKDNMYSSRTYRFFKPIAGVTWYGEFSVTVDGTDATKISTN